MQSRTGIEKQQGMGPEIKENLILIGIVLFISLWVYIAT